MYMERNFCFMRFPEGKFRAFTLSYDDAVNTDLRLMEIMRKNGIKGTFNVNSGVSADPADNAPLDAKPFARLSLPQIAEYFGDFEVATHAKTHSFFKDMPDTAVLYDIISDREVFEKMFSKRVLGHALANGSYNSKTAELLRSCGIIYSRHVKGTGDFVIPEDWLNYYPTTHHSGKLDELYERFFDTPRSFYRSPYLFTVWGHSYEFEKCDNWSLIESFLEKMGGHDNVWYAPLGEIVEYTNAYRSLVFSMDSSFVYNPTALDIWISTHPGVNEVPVMIKSGETVKLR